MGSMEASWLPSCECLAVDTGEMSSLSSGCDGTGSSETLLLKPNHVVGRTGAGGELVMESWEL